MVDCHPSMRHTAETPLHYAARHADEYLVRLFIKHGALVDAVNVRLPKKVFALLVSFLNYYYFLNLHRRAGRRRHSHFAHGQSFDREAVD